MIEDILHKNLVMYIGCRKEEKEEANVLPQSPGLRTNTQQVQDCLGALLEYPSFPVGFEANHGPWE